MKLKNKLHLVTGNDDLRPQFSDIHFINGYVYATDCHVLTRHKLTHLGFTEVDVLNLNGKSMRPNTWKEMMKMEIQEVRPEGIFATTKSNRGEGHCTFSWSYLEHSKLPDFDIIIQDAINKEPEVFKLLGVNLNNLHRAYQGLGPCFAGSVVETVTIDAKANNTAILITNNSYDNELALIMPIMMLQDPRI